MRLSAATSQVRLTVDELHQLKWLLGQLLVLLSVWALFALETGAGPVLFFCLLGLLATVYRPGLPGKIPPLVWKAAIPVMVVFIVVDFIIHGVQFLDPMVRMVGLLMLYRSFQYRSSREDMQLILLGLFILVIEGVLTVSLTFALQILLFTPVAMALLFLVNLLETSRARVLNADDWKRFRWPRYLSRIAKGLDFRLIAFSSLLFLALVSISSLIFVLMPRFDMNQNLGFLQREGTATIGFSDTIRFGDVNSLTSDSSVALRVRAPDFDRLPARPYWRMVVLDAYRDGQFRMSPSLKKSGSRAIEGLRFPDTYVGRRIFDAEDDWVFYLEGDVSRYLPLLGAFRSIRFSEKSKFWLYPETGVLALEQVPPKVFGYQVRGMQVSDRMAADAIDRSMLDALLAGKSEPAAYEEYPGTTLALPEDTEIQRYLYGLVEEITGGQDLSTEEFAEAVKEWLVENYRYDRSTPSMDAGEDPLITWMQQSDRGWCEHFTGAFVLLCRANGIPARALAGFAGGAWNSYEEYLILRNSDAHAWAEIFDGRGNWVRFDPTPAVSGMAADLFAQTAALGTFSGWTAWVDSLRMAWYRRVVNFDQSDQQMMASELKEYSTDFYEHWKQRLQSAYENVKQWLASGWDRSKVLTIAVSLTGGSVVVLAVIYTWRLLRFMAARGGRWANLLGGDPVRRQSGRLLNRFRPVWMCSREHLPEQERLRWQEAFDALQMIRFGPVESRPDHRRTFREIRHLLRQKPVTGQSGK